MTYHVRLRGQLTFKDAASAQAAFTTLMTRADTFLQESVSLDGKKIRAAWDDFVPYSGNFDVDGALGRLSEIARLAQSGKILARSEGEKHDSLIAPPPRVFGRKATKRDYTDPFALTGALTFATAATAAKAQAAIADAFGDEVPGLVTSGATLKLSMRGKTADKIVYAVRRVLYEYLPQARSGELRLKHLVFVREMHAPVAPFGPQKGPVAYVHAHGGLRFKNSEARAEAMPLLDALPYRGTPRNQRELEIRGEHTMTEASYAAAVKATQALLKRAGKGEVSLFSRWGYRNLRPKS